MNFPVDLLADVSQAELEQLAHNYMNDLLYSNPDSPEHLTLSDSTQVTINISSVGFVPLHGLNDKQKILALFSPSDSMNAVALYLLDQWWTVDDILKTADTARDGPMEVETIGERIVLYILNRVIYRDKEKSTDDLPFLCHGEKDHAKILWNKGEAVGFYSVKPSGSLCNRFSTRSYQLPVMDSIFVRKCQRGKGFGLRMLEDFVLSFKEDNLGLRYPLTKAMYKVCEKYLLQYPGDTDLLWEVESIGAPNQRTNIANKIQGMDLSAVSKSLSFTEDSIVMTEVTEEDVVMEAITTQIKEAQSMKCTVEIVEEVTILRATKVSEADLAVTTRARSGGSKRRHVGEKIMEEQSEKIIRIEDIEAETPRGEHVSTQQKTGLHDVSDLVQAEVMFSVEPEENGEDLVDTAPKEAAAMMSDTPATVIASQDLEQADVTPTTVEPQVEDDATHDPNNTSHESQITVENVASEIEEAEEDTAVLVSEEVLKEQKEAEGTQVEVTNEQAEEKVTQHAVGLSTNATSEGREVGKTGRTVVKAIKVQSETPRRRSQRHTKPEVETTSQDVGRVLRQRTVTSNPTPKRRYTRHSQKVNEELDNEANAFAEENDSSATEVVQEWAVTEGDEPEGIALIKGNGVAVDDLREEEETEKQEEPGVEDTEVKESSDRTEASEEKADEKATDEQMGKHQGETVDETEEEISTEKLTAEAAEDVIPPTEVNDEDPSEVREDEDRRTETLSFEADKEEEANNMIHEPDTVSAASETLIPDAVEEAAAPVDEEPKENNGKLQTATVLSLDRKTTCHQSVNETEETVDGECAAPENEQSEVIAAEEGVHLCVAEEQTPEPEMLVLEEEGEGKQETSTEKNVNATVEEDNSDKEKEAAANLIETRVLRSGRKSARASYQQQEENNKGEVITEEEVDCAEPVAAEEEEEVLDKDAFTITDPMEESQSADTEADIGAAEDAEDNLPPAEVDEAVSLEEEEEPAVTTRTLKRGRKSASAMPKSKSRTTRKQIQEEEQKEPEGSTSVEEIGVEEGEAGLGSAEEPQEEEQKVTEEDKIEQEKEELVPLSEEGTLQEEATPSAQEQQGQETAPQLSDLQRLTVVLVDMNKNRHDVQEETAAEEVPVEKTAAEAEVEQQEEATQQEETMADEHVPGSPDGMENTEGEKVEEEEEEEGSAERVNDAITIKEAEEERAEETAKEEEDKSVDDDEDDDDEEEEPVTETRTLRRRKNVAKTPPKHKSTRNRQKKGDEEKKDTSSVEEDEPTVQVRVLRRGRKSVPVTPRSTKKRTRKQLLEEEEKEEEEGAEEPLAVEGGGAEEEEEQAEKQTFDQDTGLEEKDSTEQVENIEPETGGEEIGTVAEEAVTLSEEGQADSTGAVAHEDAEGPVGQSDDEGKTSDEVEEEAVTTQETVEEEESTYISTVGAKDDEARGVSEEEEDNKGEVITEEEVDDAEPVTAGAEGGDGEVLANDAFTITDPVEESQSADTEADIPVVEDAEDNLPTTEADEAVSLEEEEAPAETKALRSKEKTATPRRRTRKSRKQVDEQETENSDEEEPAVTTKTLRRGRISTSATPKGKSRRTHKQIQEEKQKEPEKSTSVEEEEAVKEAAVEENRENTEEEVGADSERVESLEPEIDVKGGQDDVEQSEAITETVAEREVEASGEECDKLPRVPVTFSLRSGGETQKAPPRISPRIRRKQQDIEEEEDEEAAGASEENSGDGDEPQADPTILKSGSKSIGRNSKQLQEDVGRPEELAEAEEAEVEEEEVELGSAEESPTQGVIEQKAPEEDERELKDEPMPVSEDGTMTKEQENTAGVTAAADYLAQEGDTDTPLPKPDTHSTILTPSEEESTPSTQEQQSQETAPQLSDLQRLTVVLVDVNKSGYDVQEETAAEEEVPVEKTAAEAEVEQETMADEHVPGSPDGIENTEGKEVVEEEEGSGEKANDAITIKEAEEERVEETAKEEEDKSVDDDDDEEEEEPVTETRTLRRRKNVAKTPPKRKSTRNRQKRDEEEKEETSEAKEDEPTVKVRVLRRGRKSVPITPRSTTKRTRKQLQEEEEKEEEEKEGAEEPLAVEGGGAEEEEEQAEKQMFDQDTGLEEKDSTEQAENIEPETGEEEIGTVAEEAVMLSEEGQADSTGAVAHEDAEAPVGQSDDEGKTSDEVEEEAVTTQETVEEEHHEARRKYTERDEEEATGEKSSEEDESAVETRVLRKGGRSAPAPPRRKSKRARTQCQPEDEGKGETTPAKKVQVEETAAVQEEAKEIEENKDELAEAKNQEEAAAQKEQKTEPEGNHEPQKEATVEKNLEEDETAVETRVLRKGRRSAPAIPRRKSKRARTQCQPEDEGGEEPTPTEETFGEEEEAGPESPEETGENAAEMEVKEDEDVEEEEVENLSGVESAEDAEQLNDDSTEETAVLEKEYNSMEAETGSCMVRAEEANSAVEEDVALTQESLTAVAEGEPLDEDDSEVAEEEAPAVTTETLNSTPSRASRRQKGQGVAETRHKEEEDPEDEETQEVHPLTDDLPEIGELHAKEQTETAELSLAGQKAEPPAESDAEEQAKEEMDSPEEELSEDITVGSSEGRSLRGRVKLVAAEEKLEKLPKRRSNRKRSRVNYQETDEEDEGSGTEAATNKEEEDEVESDEDQDNKKAESSADEPELEENSREDDLDNNMGAVEGTSEKGDAINLALDTDDEVEMAGSSQENEEDEQNMLEEEDEPVVIGKRVLRGRSIPSVIITPHSKSRRCSAKDQKSEESDEDGLRSAQKRSLLKRKSTEVTPTRKSKRLSRV